jgi:beta-N-acetylglucosaminidase
MSEILIDTNIPEEIHKIAFALRSKIKIFLDENLHMLEQSLMDYGFKVVTLSTGVSDDFIRKAMGDHAILTRNSKDFIPYAYKYEFDVIAIDDIKFIDTKADRTNETVQKIANAIRESKLMSKKGIFILSIQNNGTWRLTEKTDP